MENKTKTFIKLLIFSFVLAIGTAIFNDYSHMKHESLIAVLFIISATTGLIAVMGILLET